MPGCSDRAKPRRAGLTANWSVPLGSQQTAASHAAPRLCAAMSYASLPRPAAFVRQRQVEVRGRPTCDSSQSIIATRSRGHADVARVGVAVDDARRATGESRPTLLGIEPHRRAAIAPRLTLVPVSACRRSVNDRQPRALWPALCQPMQLAECAGDATPGRLRSRAVRPPRRSSPPDRRQSAGRPWSGSAPATGHPLHGGDVATGRSPTPDQRRCAGRDDRPRGGPLTTHAPHPVDAQLRQ